jgi:hypothetical protein
MGSKVELTTQIGLGYPMGSLVELTTEIRLGSPMGGIRTRPGLHFPAPN